MSEIGSGSLTTRRRALAVLGSGIVIGWAGLSRQALSAAQARPVVTVYKSPSCGCCGLWTGHLAENGFRTKVVDRDNLHVIKRMARVPENLEACHTAMVDRYVVEGHVPASAIRRLLSERPKVIGIAVPGMPEGSPGMPSPTPVRFDVIAFTADGGQRVFMSF
ncbi:MAG: DUF411 domain-containing protein [Kiloniellaceae bacterium]